MGSGEPEQTVPAGVQPSRPVDLARVDMPVYRPRRLGVRIVFSAVAAGIVVAIVVAMLVELLFR